MLYVFWMLNCQFIEFRRKRSLWKWCESNLSIFFDFLNLLIIIR